MPGPAGATATRLAAPDADRGRGRPGAGPVRAPRAVVLASSGGESAGRSSLGGMAGDSDAAPNRRRDSDRQRRACPYFRE